MAARIKYPEGSVRTAEQILAGVTIHRMDAGSECVAVPCWNCGGRGTYPSSMIPAGLCRLYCWQNREPGTYGKLFVTTKRYVQQQQAADREAYKYELARPEIEAAAAYIARLNAYQQAERDAAAAATAARELAEKAARQHVGSVGVRMRNVSVTVDKVLAFPGRFYGEGTRYLLSFRDDAGNALTWWTSSSYNAERGDRFTLTGTVKAHETYRDEPQTVLSRCVLDYIEPATTTVAA